jgi:hypothetical protein
VNEAYLGGASGVATVVTTLIGISNLSTVYLEPDEGRTDDGTANNYPAA